MCRSIANGGRRCPCSTDPVKRAAYNARRRELRRARKQGLPDPPLPRVAEVKQMAPMISEHSEYAKRAQVSSQLVGAGNWAPGLTPIVEPSYTKQGFYKTENTGKLTEPVSWASPICDKYSLHGVIDVDELHENSAFDFGFTATASDYAELSGVEDKTLYNETFTEASVIKSSEVTFENIKKHYSYSDESFDKTVDVVNRYTGSHFAVMNEALYKKLPVREVSLITSKGSDSLEEEYAQLDTVISNAPQIPKTVYRGIQGYSPLFEKYGGLIGAWLKEKNVTLGSELSFEGYTSTSVSNSTACSFASIHGKMDSLVFEIKTPEGLNVSSVSKYAWEHEFLLPRNTRYRVVGIGEQEKPRGGTVHLIQMVAVNSKGEILDGTNADGLNPIRWDADGVFRDDPVETIDDFD